MLDNVFAPVFLMFIGLIIGFALGARQAAYEAQKTSKKAHIHTWTKWYSWGIIDQARKCTTCGWEEIAKR